MHLIHKTYKITVSGFSQDLESLKAGDFKASLDLSGKSSGLLSLKPSVSTDKRCRNYISGKYKYSIKLENL